MASITALRAMINNGWTIANRRNLISAIGKNNFDEIVLNARKLNMTGDVCEFQFVKGYLTPEAITRTKTSLLDKVKLLSSRWENPLQDYTPSFTGASQHSPLHHGIDRYGSAIREAFNGIKSGKPNKTQLIAIEAYLPIAQRMDESLSKMPPLEKDCIVYRGIHRILKSKKEKAEIFRIFDDCKPGDIITPDSGYSYCAFKKSKTNGFGGVSSEVYGTYSQTIRLPKGAKVSRSGLHEGEVLMPRNAEYRVISKTVNGNHTEVTLEYILPKKDNLQEVNKLMARYNLKSEPLDEIIKEFS